MESNGNIAGTVFFTAATQFILAMIVAEAWRLLKLMLFGQFIGDWNIAEARYTQADGTEVEMKGEAHFGWILGGTAIQDVWMGCQEGSEKVGLFGITIRFYDPKTDAWRSTWLSPIKGLVQTFIARKVIDEIVLEGKTAEGYLEKWIFSNITPKSFRWHSEETHDNGKTWLLTEEMQIRKVSAGHRTRLML